MTNPTVNTGEILFVKCVKDGIPNRDPLRDSDARRLFGPDDGRISLSDVSIKRDVRDYVLARYPEGGPKRRLGVFVRKEFDPESGVLRGREGLALALLERYRAGGAGGEPTAATPAPRRRGRGAAGGEADLERDLLAAAFDVRVFGAVFSVEKKSFNRVGPVQFGWAHSLHPVETKYVQGTVCMPAKDAQPAAPDEETGGKTQGTIWTMYQLPFAVFAMPGVINRTIAAQTGMTADDQELLLEALWKGTLHRQARGRGRQQPLLLLHVEYTDPFFRLGFLEEGLRLDSERDWRGGQPPTELAGVTLDVKALSQRLQQHAGQIVRARVWREPALRLNGELPAEQVFWPAVAEG
jgi:CRISPR-associated protein Csh2